MVAVVQIRSLDCCSLVVEAAVAELEDKAVAAAAAAAAVVVAELEDLADMQTL